ncbi:DUF421 domain-containing protein [Ureibacillus aquaedulcis]|uniref:DUF421 domain-containing protein n=1 Tax=Ureibacillus aquaedulcis TaxID=3058421 RepID=A0ABT8GKU2_9BACL|nr:YetF domain-containing protein [Ureibacillus sp. BA0131]MDN4492033.1 DUF421 domain-containing protein [Ureibacillus sp. BA0131]
MEMYMGVAIKFIVAVVCIVIILRIIGQKELSQTTPIDLIFIVLLVDIVGGMIHEKDFKFTHILFMVAVWGLLIWGAEKLTKKKTFERLIDGKPEIIIENGSVNSQLMKKENLTMQELNTQLRKKGVFNIEEVRVGILEIDGSISVDVSREDFKQ